MFWYPRSTKCANLCFIIVNLVLFMLSLGIFFGVYFGVFFCVTRYASHKVENCQVIGQQTVGIGDVDKFSMLYVDFNKDGHNMLGYGCISSNNQNSAGNYYIYPHKFYSRDEYYYCTNFKGTPSYSIPSKRLLQSKRVRITQESLIYYCQYKWSNVKLPDWMCLPEDISYQDLIQQQPCYVHYYKGNQNTKKAIQNSQERVNLREANEFAIVTFQKLPVPLDQYMCLLTFVFCPLIMSLNVFFNILVQKILKHLEKIKKQDKFCKKIGVFELDQVIYSINASQEVGQNKSQDKLIGNTKQLNTKENNLLQIQKLDNSNRQQDVAIEHQNQQLQVLEQNINEVEKNNIQIIKENDQMQIEIKALNFNSNKDENQITEQIQFQTQNKNIEIEEDLDHINLQILEEEQQEFKIIDENENDPKKLEYPNSKDN